MHLSADALMNSSAPPVETCTALVTPYTPPARPAYRHPANNSTRPLPGRGGDQGEGRPRRRLQHQKPFAKPRPEAALSPRGPGRLKNKGCHMDTAPYPAARMNAVPTSRTNGIRYSET